jgi:hypothetical protein
VNDIDAWLHFDGLMPEHLRQVLDALRDLPPSTTPEHAEGGAPGGVAFGLHDLGGALCGHGALQPSR